MSHIFSCRVYYEDTDAGGVVYYANYLKFAERARTEMVREAGIVQAELLREHGIAFVVREARMEFFKPARLDDLLTIESVLQDIGKASITMNQALRKHTETLVQLHVRIAVVNAGFRPVRLPPGLRERLLAQYNS